MEGVGVGVGASCTRLSVEALLSTDGGLKGASAARETMAVVSAAPWLWAERLRPTVVKLGAQPSW